MALSKGHTFTSGEVVTPTKLNNLVDNATIGDGTITTAMIADDAVTADKIANGAVTSDALASGVGGASAINDLTDVDTSSVAPTDGQALVWDNANSKWEPGTVSGGSSGASKYDSGWVSDDGSTTVANGATLTFTHSLSTSAINAQIWVSGASDGSNPYLMDIQETFSNTSMVGAGITNITSTQITIQFSDSGYVYMNSSGQNATSTVNGHDAASSGYVPFTSKYVRVVAIG